MVWGQLRRMLCHFIIVTLIIKGFLDEGMKELLYTGFSSQQGEIIYGGIDLALSGYGLFRNVISPEKNRLFYWMYTDTVVGFKDMKGPALTIGGMKDSKDAGK